jgi:hypothetical protein
VQKVCVQDTTVDVWVCRMGLTAVKADTGPLIQVTEQVDGEADLAELTASSAAAAETGAALGLRQAEALEAASQELLCSPEITRCARSRLSA